MHRFYCGHLNAKKVLMLLMQELISMPLNLMAVAVMTLMHNGRNNFASGHSLEKLFDDGANFLGGIAFTRDNQFCSQSF